MDTRIRRFVTISLFILLLAPRGALPEELYSDLGFFIDLPEGWGVSGGDGKMEFEFSDPSAQAFISLTAFPRGKYPSAEAIHSSLRSSLGAADATSGNFLYSGKDSVLADFSFKDGTASLRGYGLFILGAAYQYEIVAYTTSAKFASYNDFLVSALDSFSIDEAARRLPGPISQFDTPFPGKNLRKGTIDFLGKRIEISMDAQGEEACQALVEREFRILKAYAKTPQLVQQADARFYRMIYRDSYARLAEIALLVARELDGRAAEALSSPKDAVDAEKATASGIPLGNEDTQKARELLAWVQGFSYERDLKSSDVVNPLSAALHAKGDCDGRSLLMAILLHRLNIDAIIMISPAYAHGMVACDVPGGGKRFAFKGKNWIVGETTAKAGSGVGLGLIAKDMSDFSKWYGVDFGF